MQTLTNILGNFGLSIIGLIGFALYSVRSHLYNFNFKIFIKENWVFWVWAAIAQLLYSIVMGFYPVLEQTVADRLIDVINAAFAAQWEIPKGLTVTVVYLLGTYLLSRIVNKNVKPKDKIGKTKDV